MEDGCVTAAGTQHHVAEAAAATQQHSYSKDKLEGVAKTEEGVTRARRIVMQTAAAGPCDPKSESEVTSVKVSVIFPSSRCGDTSLRASSHSGTSQGHVSVNVHKETMYSFLHMK
jgi:hypothetical protein